MTSVRAQLALRVRLQAADALLERSRLASDPHAMQRHFCRDVIAGCGFGRLALSSVAADSWQPVVLAAGEPDKSPELAQRLIGAEIAFGSAPTERLVRDTLSAAVHRADALPPPQLADLASSYLVAPLRSSDGLIGLLHADHGRSGAPITPEDIDLLSLLADGFARRYERARLAERLTSQWTLLVNALARSEGDARDIVSAPVGLDDVPSGRSIPAQFELGLPAVLTPRERDVAELLARGYSNAAIARELVIVPGTAKVHVKNVMRKLRASTRAEAVARIITASTSAPDAARPVEPPVTAAP